MNKIYVIEDDETLRNELVRILSLQGIEALACTDFEHAAESALAAQPNAIIMDLRLPNNDGLAICREVRAASSIPIMVLTSSDAEFDEVMSMKLGADDYLTKPYSPAVLLAHVERLLQRSTPNLQTLLTYNGLEFDTKRARISNKGKSAELSRNEQRILLLLMKAKGAIVSRQELMYELWQSDEFIDDNTLTVNVNRLRKVLLGIGAPEEMLHTHRGQGYSL